MSGRRACHFSFLDFANLNIHNSVILVDELELHLHPPLQQTLIRTVTDLGTNNQFIVTTHSGIGSLGPPTGMRAVLGGLSMPITAAGTMLSARAGRKAWMLPC